MTDYPDPSPTRPLWVVTLADLALLLVGFLVLVQATGHSDRGTLVKALRQGFGDAPPAPVMPVAAMVVTGFAPGSAVTAPPAGLTGWARDAVRDPRVRLTITGATDGTSADVDPASGSAAVLAAARAARIAALLAPVLRADRLTIATSPLPGPRAATVTIGFAGEPPKDR